MSKRDITKEEIGPFTHLQAEINRMNDRVRTLELKSKSLESQVESIARSLEGIVVLLGTRKR